MIKQLLNTVETALKNVPEVAYINEDWGQLDYYDTRPPVRWPCVLLEVEGVNYKTMGGVQYGEGILSVRVADFRNMQQANAKADGVTPRNEMFDVVGLVHSAVQGLSTEVVSRLNRDTLKRVRRDDAIREVVLTYHFTIKDATTVKKTIVANPNPQIVVAT